MKSKNEFASEKEYNEYLRKYFAGLAMQGFISSGKHNSIPSDICKTSIKLADELLKQLEI